ncbi:FtsX-like permease family protein [Deltaproteobacteria bacterium TL4]
MIRFLFKGLIRDRSRSLFPILIVSAGVMLTVLLDAWIRGALGNFIETNARFQTGHVRVLTQGYAKQQQQNPMDLALGETSHWLKVLQSNYPSVNWQLRTRFGGLLDFPDSKGETFAQGSVAGMAVDLFSKDTQEFYYLNLKNSLVQGYLPEKSGEILVSETFFKKLNLSLGQQATLISSGMDGGMVVYNFKVVGTINFGVKSLDRGAMLADITDIQDALNMPDAASEIFGYFKVGHYLEKKSDQITSQFNQQYSQPDNSFSPLMVNLKDQEDLGVMIELFDNVTYIITGIFVFLMGIVLWNTGLMSGIRRYGEFGVRLAMGETQKHIYLTLIIESVIIGSLGAILGTLLGLLPAVYLQEVGIDFSGLLKSSGVLMSDVMRAEITATTIWIGFLPGLFATLIGALFSGIGIYKRQTTELFKELEI